SGTDIMTCQRANRATDVRVLKDQRSPIGIRGEKFESWPNSLEFSNPCPLSVVTCLVSIIAGSIKHPATSPIIANQRPIRRKDRDEPPSSPIDDSTLWEIHRLLKGYGYGRSRRKRYGYGRSRRFSAVWRPLHERIRKQERLPSPLQTRRG